MQIMLPIPDCEFSGPLRETATRYHRTVESQITITVVRFPAELARIKQQLTAGTGETLFDAQRLNRVQSDIGDQANQLSKSGDPKDRMLGGQLRDLNEN